MKTYTCVCGQLIFFQNVSCVNCKRELGFLPDVLAMSSIEPAGEGTWQPTRNVNAQADLYRNARADLYRKCQNYSKEDICNWMIPQSDAEEFCVSCRLNEIIPDLTQTGNRELWTLAEAAKRRLVYSLLRLGLPVASKKVEGQSGLAFRFLSDVANADGTVTKTMTGHNDGTITLNIAEARDAYRETVRNEMKEPYRTLLGHFRHEIGHYYWDRLIRDSARLQAYRDLFGDERADYMEALNRHYQSGAPANWQDNFISAYATAHPWEDWAETWAHFLHIQDALEVANDFGLVGKPILLGPADKNDEARRPRLSERQVTFDGVIKAWSELAVALNSINRSMGLSDLYPFVLSTPVIAKLRFVYEVVQGKLTAENGPEAGANQPVTAAVAAS